MRPQVASLSSGLAERREVKSSPAESRSAASVESSCADPEARRMEGLGEEEDFQKVLAWWRRSLMCCFRPWSW